MRNFRNLTKRENEELSKKFSFLLKYNEDCTAEDFSWSAITVFDHWLYESDSFSIISNATEDQKRSWDKAIKSFLAQLVELEKPFKYKYIGRNSKQKLQFSRFIGDDDFGLYVSNLFDEVYSPNLVFNRLGVELWFEDNWTIHFKYKKQEECLGMLKLASNLGLFVLPAYSADHLNNYQTLSKYLGEQGLNKSLHRTANASAE
ncbi:hypothetical protein [Glaciecola petra]|uniref:Uncharacterized protein n=1 Tax=Glaciecola petra TaxID=3075602 RepID=A0ABU2ZUS8_9ALTE|nr:hypothetical protein [Aestuariibacter sp. P117]MDT0596398.1 hypothetical protein [Aestuariibacter sp. P117]